MDRDPSCDNEGHCWSSQVPFELSITQLAFPRHDVNANAEAKIISMNECRVACGFYVRLIHATVSWPRAEDVKHIGNGSPSFRFEALTRTFCAYFPLFFVLHRRLRRFQIPTFRPRRPRRPHHAGCKSPKSYIQSDGPSNSCSTCNLPTS